MLVRAGYKMSEVGVIPEDWGECRIDSVCTLVNGRGFKPFEWKKSGLPIIRIQNLNGSDDYNYFDGRYDKKLEVEPGQLLFAWSGSRGTSFGPHIWPGPLGLLNYHTWKIQIRRSEIDQDFFLYALKHLTSFIEDNAHGASALVHTQKWEMEGFRFGLPPTLAEQSAIAQALGDADALIESLERLLAKKRHIKQGAMQDLLTGKRRLPGFVGAWEERRLDELGKWTGGMTPSMRNPDYWRYGMIPWISSGDVKSVRLTTTAFAISEHAVRHKATTMLPAKSIIVVTRSGILRKFLPVAINMIPMAINQDIKALLPHDRLLPDYILHALIFSGERILARCLKSGTTVESIEFPWLKAFTIPIPLAAEQSAIATVLSDMDAEIDALDAKLAKARALKQGMMQALLTGRIRLP